MLITILSILLWVPTLYLVIKINDVILEHINSGLGKKEDVNKVLIIKE